MSTDNSNRLVFSLERDAIRTADGTAAAQYVLGVTPEGRTYESESQINPDLKGVKDPDAIRRFIFEGMREDFSHDLWLALEDIPDEAFKLGFVKATLDEYEEGC